MTEDKQFCHIKQVDWELEQDRIMSIRNEVFVIEQAVPMEEEMDGLDKQCWFVLAEDDKGHPIGTGRLLPSGKIGRMAVLKFYRNRGVGSAILTALIKLALENNLTDLYLHGQIHAKQFYNNHGFIEEGAVFDEAGIPHIKMRFSRHP